MQYRPHRYPTDYRLTVTAAGRRETALIVDVSRTGARLSGIEGLQRGDKIDLDVLSNRVESVVLWSRSGFAGVPFRPAINDHMVDVLRKRVDGHRQFGGASVGFQFSEMR